MFEVVEWIEDAEVECACLAPNPFMFGGGPTKLVTELEADADALGS
jgi:hypothetical protein